MQSRHVTASTPSTSQSPSKPRRTPKRSRTNPGRRCGTASANCGPLLTNSQHLGGGSQTSTNLRQTRALRVGGNQNTSHLSPLTSLSPLAYHLSLTSRLLLITLTTLRYPPSCATTVYPYSGIACSSHTTPQCLSSALDKRHPPKRTEYAEANQLCKKKTNMSGKKNS